MRNGEMKNHFIPKHEPLTVTRPYLPPLEEFIPYLNKIWENHWLTNNGPFHQQLELALQEYLGVEHISLLANGTLALMIAMRVLGIRGEVITTPFSFVATSHALHWNGISPIFVDIDPLTFNIDPTKIEDAITPKTTAILPVHVYGTPCDVETLDCIAETRGLKMIYDAAHAFGAKHKGASLASYGDVSILSFHATKIFSTIEGGAIVCHDANIKKEIELLRNFGIADETTVIGTGINAKLNELQAAFGLMQLAHVEEEIRERIAACDWYRHALAGLQGIRIPGIPITASQNGGYFPILVEPEYPLSRDELFRRMRSDNIMSRRYFYPLISEFPAYAELPSASKQNLPAAHAVSSSIICLPLYAGLNESDQKRVVDVIARNACL
jgi:dTDP-4-amino-4,6-dideoxy-D-glucose transaminase